MDYDRFLGHVQHRARLATPGEAVAATRATLETLGERIDPNEAHHLAAQLPQEIGTFLDNNLHEKGERFDLDTFCRRVAGREGTDVPEATFHARCVLDVVSEAVSAGELQQVRSELPKEFQPLFDSGSEGTMRLD